ncbi:DUF4440 domain-containing protein, partial [Roseisolibacter sp. H3M3-2]|uniref:YybH family protein n=1 Tax=Roseisolibacter sp. H3M3-2 TaxID=3031323 RepID=UPI0023DCC587
GLRGDLRAADAELSRRSAEQGLLAAVVPRLTDDAWYLQVARPVVRGREAVRTMLATTDAATGATRFAWRAVRADVSSDGRLGYTWGYGQVGEPATSRHGYIVMWRRASTAESWSVAAFLRNNAGANLAAAPAGFGTPDERHARYLPKSDTAALAREITARDLAFSALSAARGLATGFSTFAAPDGALLAGVFGPDAIRAAQSPTPPGPGSGWAPVGAEVAASGDLGFTVGNATFHPAGGGAPAYSKYLSIWKRQPDGAWLYVMDGGSARPAG